MEVKTGKAIGQLISRSKMFRGEIDKPFTAFNAFNNTLVEVYNYSFHYYKKYTTSCEYYDFEQYRAEIYKSVINLEPLPDDITDYINFYFRGAPVVEEIDTKFMELLVSAIHSDEEDKKADMERIKKNEEETAELRELLSKCTVRGSFDLIYPLIVWAENHDVLNTPFLCNLFAYGYITGKRAERSRRKKKKA